MVLTVHEAGPAARARGASGRSEAARRRAQVEAKTAFLESKGVDAFTIAQAACVSLADYEAFGPVQTEKYA